MNLVVFIWRLLLRLLPDAGTAAEAYALPCDGGPVLLMRSGRWIARAGDGWMQVAPCSGWGARPPSGRRAGVRFGDPTAGESGLSPGIARLRLPG